LPDGGDLNLVDAGCGEGYYLDYLVRELQQSEAGGGIACIGVDISRAAIIAATRRNRQVSWIVASNRQLPVLAASVDMVICMFGFESPEGFKKILKPGGQVILVQPGTGHLAELRRIIYPQIRESGPPDPVRFEQAGFAVTQSRPLRFRTGAVGQQQIDSLLLMTPHLFRATREGKEAAARLESLDLTVDVVFTSLVLNYNRAA